MGSKVSSKMAAPAARVIQAVRPHAPLIKFPNRQTLPKPNAQEMLNVLGASLPQQSTSPTPFVQSHISAPRPPSAPIPGSPDTLASIRQLPARYRRRLLTVEEIDYIQRGGPE